MTAQVSQVGAWVKTPRDQEVTEQAIKCADELGWNEGTYPEWFAFVSGFRQGRLTVTDLRSHEPPRTTDRPFWALGT